MKSLIKLDNDEVLIEILGELGRYQISHSWLKPETKLLVGRVMDNGPYDSEKSANNKMEEDDLVVIVAQDGIVIRDGESEYRVISRQSPLLVLDTNELSSAGIEPENLLVLPAPAEPETVSVNPAEMAPEPEVIPEPEPEPVIPQIAIEYINQRGQGFAAHIEIPEGTTLAGLLELKGIAPKGRELRVLTPTLGEVPPMADYVLQPGDHVEAVPVEVGVGFSG